MPPIAWPTRHLPVSSHLAAGVVALGGRLLVENEDFFALVTAGILARHRSVEVTGAKGTGLDGAARLAESGEPGLYASAAHHGEVAP